MLRGCDICIEYLIHKCDIKFKSLIIDKFKID